MLKIGNVTFDCENPARVAEFWGDGARVQGREHQRGLRRWPPTRRAPAPNLLFIKVPEPRTVKNRMHMDVAADDREAEIERLIGLGATRGETHSDAGVRRSPGRSCRTPRATSCASARKARSESYASAGRGRTAAMADDRLAARRTRLTATELLRLLAGDAARGRSEPRPATSTSPVPSPECGEWSARDDPRLRCSAACADVWGASVSIAMIESRPRANADRGCPARYVRCGTTESSVCSRSNVLLAAFAAQRVRFAPSTRLAGCTRGLSARGRDVARRTVRGREHDVLLATRAAMRLRSAASTGRRSTATPSGGG